MRHERTSPPAVRRATSTDPDTRGPDTGRPDTRAEVDPDVAELLGLRPADADDVPDVGEIDAGADMTDTAIGAGGLTAREPGSPQPDVERLESLADEEARAGETDDPTEAAEEGLAWVPPIDPPVVPGRAGGEVEVAAGFGTTAEDEPFDADHHGEPVPETDERATRVVEALRADARTSRFADQLTVDADGARVTLDGTVDDLDDEDAAMAVAEEVPGVREVRSRVVVSALEGTDTR